MWAINNFCNQDQAKYKEVGVGMEIEPISLEGVIQLLPYGGLGFQPLKAFLWHLN